MTDWADKISKLLRKAESTPFEAERESYVEKAQALMVQYSISEAMLAEKKPEEREPIEREYFEYIGSFQQSLWHIGSAVARANGCKTLISENRRVYSPDANSPKRKTTLHVIGFKSDVSRARMLDASLQIQAIAAMNEYVKDAAFRYMSSKDKYKAKRGFLLGFAEGVDDQLYRARRAGEQAQAEEIVNLHEAETAEAAAESVALVVRSRADQVQDWVDQNYGKTRRGRSSNYGWNSAGASSAGYSAGQRADAGQPRVGGSRGKLPS